MQSISGMASSIHDRRFLKYRKILESSIPISPSTPVSTRSTVVNDHVAKTCFDWSIAIILGTLLCFVLCALSVSALLRYRLRCRQQRWASEAGIDVGVGVKSESGKKIDIRAMPAPLNGTGSPLASMDCPVYSTEIVEGEKNEGCVEEGVCVAENVIIEQSLPLSERNPFSFGSPSAIGSY